MKLGNVSDGNRRQQTSTPLSSVTQRTSSSASIPVSTISQRSNSITSSAFTQSRSTTTSTLASCCVVLNKNIERLILKYVVGFFEERCLKTVSFHFLDQIHFHMSCLVYQSMTMMICSRKITWNRTPNDKRYQNSSIYVHLFVHLIVLNIYRMFRNEFWILFSKLSSGKLKTEANDCNQPSIIVS